MCSIFMTACIPLTACRMCTNEYNKSNNRILIMIIIDICITVRVCVDVLFNSNKSSFITFCAHEHTHTQSVCIRHYHICKWIKLEHAQHLKPYVFHTNGHLKYPTISYTDIHINACCMCYFVKRLDARHLYLARPHSHQRKMRTK